MGNVLFSKVQYGVENPAAHGTPVVATKKLLGKTPSRKTDRKPVYPNEDVGTRTDAVRSVIHQYLYNNTLSTEHGYFQQLPMLGGCGLKGAVTPVEQTPAQNDMLWDQSPSIAFDVLNNPDSLTLELGDDQQAWKTEYAMFERIRISWQVAQGMDASPVNIESDFFSRQLTKANFTAGLYSPVVEPLNGKLARVYFDPTWGDVGETELQNILRGADIEILTGVHPTFSGSGNKYFNKHEEGLIMVTANLTLEENADAIAIFDAQNDQSFGVLRFDIQGGQIGTGENHQFTLDIGGTFEDVDPGSSEDRTDNLQSVVFRGFGDETAGKLLQWKVITNSSAY